MIAGMASPVPSGIGVGLGVGLRIKNSVLSEVCPMASLLLMWLFLPRHTVWQFFTLAILN